MSSNNNSREWYWLIGGGPMQVNVIKHIKALGFKVIITDGDADCVGKKYADIFFPVDTHDWQKHLSLKKELLLRGVWEKIKGVSCIATDSHFTVANLVKELNIPGITPELSLEIGNKSKLRMSLFGLGVLQPKFIILDSSMNHNEIKPHISNFVLDIKSREFFIKPIGHSASVGLMICKNENEEEIWTKVKQAFKISKTSQIIVEERLTWDKKFASEASIETLVHSGDVLFLNMVDRIFEKDLSVLNNIELPKALAPGVEFGHVNPTIRNSKEIKHLISVLQKFINQLKERGVYKNETFILKADIFFSEKGPIILEATPRTSGGWDSSYSSLKRGLNIQELAINISLDRKFTLPKGSTSFVAVVTNASEYFQNNKGRKFYGGEASHDMLGAVQSALRAKKMGKNL